MATLSQLSYCPELWTGVGRVDEYIDRGVIGKRAGGGEGAGSRSVGGVGVGGRGGVLR